MSDLYDRDVYAWANEQAGLLRAGKLSDADTINIAAEIESMGRSEKRELVSRLASLLLHLLPATCPYNFSDMLDEAFRPGEAPDDALSRR
jgi:hypothetical protein